MLDKFSEQLHADTLQRIDAFNRVWHKACKSTVLC